MAEVITIQDVRDYTGTDLPDDIVSAYFDVIDEADACLDGNNVSASRQRLLKLNGVGHLISSSIAASGVESMDGPLGDSIKFAKGASSLERTPYGQQLRMLDSTNCIINLFSDSKAVFFAIDGDPKC